MYRKIYIGIDLAAKESRCSGIAVIDTELRLSNISCLYEDSEILEFIRDLTKGFDIVILSIDAPLRLAKGFRDVDKKMVRLGYRVFPPNFSFMKFLTKRAMRLLKSLFKLNIIVLETHPRSALLSSRCNSVFELLKVYSIVVPDEKMIEILQKSKDLSDAVIAAIVSLSFDLNNAVPVCDYRDCIWILKPLCNG